MNNGLRIKIASVFLIGLSGCNTLHVVQENPKNEQSTRATNTAEEQISAVILDGETYSFHTGMSGDEQGASISKKPKHALLSEMIRDSSTNWEPVYRYTPQPGYAGQDSVELILSNTILAPSPDEMKTETKRILIIFSIQ